MMIPVETGMYQNPTAVNFAAPLQGYEQGQQMRLRDLQMQNQQQQQQMEGIKLSDMTRTAQFQQALRGSYSVDPDSGQLTQDPDKLNAAAQIDPMAYSAFKQQQSANQLAAAKSQAELHQTQLGDMASILGRATDDDSYQAAVKQATAKGYLHDGELPDSYADATAPGPNSAPSPLQQHLATTLSYQDQIANKLKQQQADAETAKANATVSEADTKAKTLPYTAQTAAADTTKANAAAAEVGAKTQQLAFDSQKYFGDKDYQEAKDLGTHLDKGWAARSGAAGAVQTKLNSADAAQGLIDQGKNQPGGLDARQVGELATSVSSLLGGGQISDSRVDELLPETAKSRGMHWMEYMTNAPQGAELQGFTDRLGETVQRERGIADSQKKQFQIEGLSDFSDLKQRNPQQYNQQLQSRGIDPSIIDSKGRYKPPIGKTGGPPLSQQDALQEARKRGLIQ